MAAAARCSARGDPPAFEIVNPQGAAPIVFLCDHASNRVPLALDHLGLPPEELERHIAWDIGAAALTRRLAAHFDAPAVLAGYSRLVIDCNRRFESEQSILAASDGTVVPGNQDLTGPGRRRPGTSVLPALSPGVRRRARRRGGAGRGAAGRDDAQLHPGHERNPRPWHAGVLWHEDGRVALPLLRALRARGDLVVGDNEPYSGASPHGYTMPEHAARHGRANVQIEVRQDLVADETGIERWSAILIEALSEVLTDPSIHERRAA